MREGKEKENPISKALEMGNRCTMEAAFIGENHIAGRG